MVKLTAFQAVAMGSSPIIRNFFKKYSSSKSVPLA